MAQCNGPVRQRPVIRREPDSGHSLSGAGARGRPSGVEAAARCRARPPPHPHRGPGGAGKSLLLPQWAATHPELDFVWLEVGADDDDPVRFSQRLLRDSPPSTPISPISPRLSPSTVAAWTPLLEAFEAQLGEFPDVVIVLDDSTTCRTPSSSPISETWSTASRPISIWSCRPGRISPSRGVGIGCAGRLTEIRQSDLALDDSRLGPSPRAHHRASPGVRQGGRPGSRTEGWAAGLQLAGMTLRLYEDPTSSSPSSAATTG